MKKQILNEEFKRMQKLAGIINEAEVPTFISKVDWYYIDYDSDYPGPKGRVVPDAEGYDDVSQYEGTELYMPKGTKGYVEDDDFINDEGSNIPFEPEYFEEYSENQINEEEDNDLDIIVQKLKSKYDVSVKDDSIFLKTYYKNGSLKNWYTIKKVGDDMYRFSKGGRQLRDWSLDDLFSNLLDNPNISL